MKLVIWPDAFVCLGDLALERQQIEQPFALIDRRIPVQERPAAEAVGQQDRHIVERRPYAFPFGGLSSLVDEVGAELSLRPFGTWAASRTASNHWLQT